MNPASPGRFIYILYDALLVMAFSWLLAAGAMSGEFVNTIALLGSIYAAYYALVAVAKAFNTWRTARVLHPDGAECFIMWAAWLLLVIVVPPVAAGILPSGTLMMVTFLVLYGLCIFAPWVALLVKPKYRHMRTQGIWGIASLFLLPVLLFFANIAFFFLRGVPLRWGLPFAAALCLGFWVARRMGEKWRKNAGIAVLAVVLLGIAAFWWHMRPYNAAEEAAEHYRDYAKAIEILRPLAEDGSEKAAFLIGLYYTAAMNPKPDPAASVKWHIIAANNGGALSAYIVARAYVDGNGVGRDMAEAVKWFRKAAEEGETGAQMTLGEFYQKGEGGLPQDMYKAEEWLVRAGNQGQPEAYEKLYWLYRKGGPGLSPDKGKAFFWYLVWSNYTASSFLNYCPDTVEHPPKQDNRSGAEKFRDMSGVPPQGCHESEFEPMMTAAQIAAAKNRYSDWNAKPEKFWNKFSFF